MPGEWKRVRIGKDIYEQRVSYVDEEGKTHYEVRALPGSTEGTSEEGKTYTTHTEVKKSKKKAEEEKQQQQQTEWERFKKQQDLKESKTGVISGPGFAIHPSYGPPEERGKLLIKHLGLAQGSTVDQAPGSFEYLKEHADAREKIFIQRIENMFPSPAKTGLMQIGGIKAYHSLSPSEKQEYGFLFTDWSEIPSGELKYYPGSGLYFESLSPGQKEDLIQSIIGDTKGAFPIEGISDISILQLSRRAAQYVQKGMSFQEARQKTIWEALTTDIPSFKTETYGMMPFFERSSFAVGSVFQSAALWPISLTQTGLKYVSGEGALTDPIERIKTGKTLGLFPDVVQTIEGQHMGPHGGINVAFSEVVGLFTGDHSELEMAKKYPVETFFATIGEIGGLYVGGQALQMAKSSVIKGGGFIRSAAAKHRISLPSYSQISRYYPQTMLRSWWVRRGSKNIDDFIEIPYHSTETLTPGGLSFAPGSTPGQRIGWTIEQSRLSQELLHSEGQILLGSASGGRIGRHFAIQAKTIHELPSMSYAPYGYTPTRFYRLGAVSYEAPGLSLFPKFHLPSGFATRIKKLFQPPRGSYEEVGKWASQQPKGSWGVVGPKMIVGGRETEINLFGKTILERYLPSGSKKLLSRVKGYEYYVNVEGRSIPIVFTDPVHKGFPSAIELISEKIPSDVKEFFSLSSSTGAKSIPIINPGYLLSKISSSVSRSAPSSYPLSIISSVPSKPRSRPSSEISISSLLSIPSSPSVISKASGSSVVSRSSIVSKPSIPSKKVISETYIPTPDYSFTDYPPPPERKKRKKSQEDLLKKAFEVPKAFRHRVHPVELIEVNL